MNKTILYIILSILFVGVIGGSYYLTGGYKFATTSACSEKKQNGLILIPLGGRIECEQISGVTSYSDTSFGENGIIITFGDKENSPKSEEILASCDEDANIGLRYDGRYNPSAKCKIGEDCEPIFFSAKVSQMFTAFGGGMENGEQLQIYCRKTYFGGLIKWKYVSGKVRET
ncbi:hypothetical protein KKG81_10775, partial [bacterium]|nr:hypothetical protein [bacterium]